LFSAKLAELTRALHVVSLRLNDRTVTKRTALRSRPSNYPKPPGQGKMQPYISKEDNMLEVTPIATEQIAAYFSDKEVKPIRIFLNEGG
jgi:hypothetical protein